MSQSLRVCLLFVRHPVAMGKASDYRTCCSAANRFHVSVTDPASLITGVKCVRHFIVHLEFIYTRTHIIIGDNRNFSFQITALRRNRLRTAVP